MSSARWSRWRAASRAGTPPTRTSAGGGRQLPVGLLPGAGEPRADGHRHPRRARRPGPDAARLGPRAGAAAPPPNLAGAVQVTNFGAVRQIAAFAGERLVRAV